jgi:hypothetical protein
VTYSLSLRPSRGSTKSVVDKNAPFSKKNSVLVQQDKNFSLMKVNSNIAAHRKKSETVRSTSK